MTTGADAHVVHLKCKTCMDCGNRRQSISYGTRKYRSGDYEQGKPSDFDCAVAFAHARHCFCMHETNPDATLSRSFYTSANCM
jgi:hypothetical protein